MAATPDPVNREENTKEEDQKRFQEQCFLLDFYEKFTVANTDRFDKSKQKTYNNFLQLTKSKPSVLLNKLLGSRIEDFLNITPGQLSLLQPKIRFFKEHAVNGKEAIHEFFFDDFFNKKKFESIVQNKNQRGSGVGLKKFEWEDMGTTPGDTGKAFSATLHLHFQSIEDLFYKQQRSGIAFADLIRTPPKESSSGIQDDRYFRILVQVGWQTPPPESLEAIASFGAGTSGRAGIEALRKAIEKMTVTMFLTLTNHEFDYRDDGTIELVAHYVGAIEGKFLSPEADVLYIGKDNNRLISLYDKSLTSYQEQKDQLLDKISKEKTGSSEAQLEKDELTLDLEVEKNIENFNHLKENIIQENKSRSYQRLLDSIEKQNRIYFVDLSKEQIQFFNDVNSILRDPSLSFEQVNRKLANFRDASGEYVNKGKTITIQPESYDAIGGNRPDTFKNLKSEVKGAIESKKNVDDQNKVIDAADGKIAFADTAKSPNHIRINYVYLGDLINSALSVIYDKDDPIMNKGLDHGDLKEKFRVILGTMEMFDPLTNKKTIVDLCDIPISLNLFHSWFLRKVIRPQLRNYLLRDFLKDVCSELLLNALSPVCLGGAARAVKNSVSFSVFSLPAKQDSTSPFSNFPGERLDVDSLPPDAVNTSPHLKEDMKHYMMIYISGYSPDHLKGDQFEDAKNGVYHFFYGSDRGILKNVKFSKTDMPYVKEARIAEANLTRKGDLFLSEPYNAKAILWGNTIFKPGMILYLDPRSFGMGKAVPRDERLPIGGYYIITKAFGEISPGNFKSTIDLNFVTSGDKKTESATNNISGVTPKGGATQLITAVPVRGLR